MSNATIKAFVNATSHSFEDNTWGPQAYAAYPTIPFYETESNYGSLGATTQVQDWAAGSTIFNTEAPFLATGRTSVYTHWNMVNNQKSQSGWGWAQYVMITVDTTNGKVTYNPYFYAQKHLSHYVQVGAKAVNFTTNGISNLTSAAFLNPNGDIILVMNSTNTAAVALTVKVGTEMYKATLPANSFTTIRIATTTAVQCPIQLKNDAVFALSNMSIRNSTLFFSLPAGVNAREANLTLADLHGRIVWTARRAGSALQGSRQTFTIRSESGNLRSGSYLLTARIKNEAGAVTTVEGKVATVN